MDRGTMFAHKLLALYDRTANRDLWDVYFFLKNRFEINEYVIEERLGKSLKTLLSEIIEQIPSKFSSKTILFALGEVLTEKQKYRVKNSLAKETVFQLQILRDSL